jgi:imidazolonepropionase
MILLKNARQLVTPLASGDFQVLENAAIAAENGQILFVGSTEEASEKFPSAEGVDASGKVVLPGFVDAHTHSIFGGDRCNEFLMRLRGATYQEIAAAGGGIQSTVKATRSASEEELLEKTKTHLKKMLQFGTTTVEIKSGYGLDWPTERKLLKIARALQKITPLDVVVTFLGAHDFPREKSRDEYLTELVMEMLPEVKAENLAEFSDVFCDQGYYTNEQTQLICERATELGLKIKLHVDELADVNGAALAARLGAVSADHLILANEAGIEQMAKAGVIAVLLPGTSFALKCKQHAPARKMIEAGVRVALATDFNPGTCYSHSMQYILQLSCLLYGLTPEEAITAATLNGAAAVDREKQLGSLEAGKQMDCLIFDIPHYGHLFYNLGVNRLESVVKRGKIIWTRK